MTKYNFDTITIYKIKYPIVDIDFILNKDNEKHLISIKKTQRKICFVKYGNAIAAHVDIREYDILKCNIFKNKIHYIIFNLVPDSNRISLSTIDDIRNVASLIKTYPVLNIEGFTAASLKNIDRFFLAHNNIPIMTVSKQYNKTNNYIINGTTSLNNKVKLFFKQEFYSTPKEIEQQFSNLYLHLNDIDILK